MTTTTHLTDHSSSRTTRRLVLTPTDIQLLRWLWMLRVLTLSQLRRIGYYQPDTGRLSALDNVRKRLRRRANQGYLVGDTLLETRERIYFLGERALAPLREHCGIEQRRLYKPKGLDTSRQIFHSLMVSECAVRVYEGVRGTDAEIPDLAPLGLPFYHTHAVGDPSKKRHTERFVTQEDLHVSGHPKPFRIRPDLVFALAKDGTHRLFFLEADRGTEGSKAIAAKQHGYHHLQKARDPITPSEYRWQRYGPIRDFRVLFVTTTERRIDSLRRSLHRQPGFELFGFTALRQLEEINPIFDPIWKVQDDRSTSLLKR